MRTVLAQTNDVSVTVKVCRRSHGTEHEVTTTNAFNSMKHGRKPRQGLGSLHRLLEHQTRMLFAPRMFRTPARLKSSSNSVQQQSNFFLWSSFSNAFSIYGHVLSAQKSILEVGTLNREMKWKEKRGKRSKRKMD